MLNHLEALLRVEPLDADDIEAVVIKGGRMLTTNVRTLIDVKFVHAGIVLLAVV